MDNKTWRSPNFNERIRVSPDRAEPSMIVLHYTGMETAQAALERLCDPVAEVSAHYVVDTDGSIYHLVDDQHRAWHAGKSYWEGLTDINSLSIGIEIVNQGHEIDYAPFPEVQIASVAVLCRDLIARYAIRADKVVAHSDIAPGRKIDPGELFPWQVLAEQGIGLWPSPNEIDSQAGADLVNNLDAIYELLVCLGYNPEVDLDMILREFHRHFLPEKLLGQGNPFTADAKTCTALLSLLRQKNDLVG